MWPQLTYTLNRVVCQCQSQNTVVGMCQPTQPQCTWYSVPGDLNLALLQPYRHPPPARPTDNHKTGSCAASFHPSGLSTSAPAACTGHMPWPLALAIHMHIDTRHARFSCISSGNQARRVHAAHSLRCIPPSWRQLRAYANLLSPMMCPPKKGAISSTDCWYSTGMPSSTKNLTISPAWGDSTGTKVPSCST